MADNRIIPGAADIAMHNLFIAPAKEANLGPPTDGYPRAGNPSTPKPVVPQSFSVLSLRLANASRRNEAPAGTRRGR